MNIKSVDPALFLEQPYCHPLAEVSLHDLGEGVEEPCGNDWFTAGLMTEAIARAEISDTGMEMTRFLLDAAGISNDQANALVRKVQETERSTEAHEAAVRELICQLANGYTANVQAQLGQGE